MGLAGFLASSVPWAGTDLEPPDLGRYFKWGPLRVRPGLVVSDMGYDDNILSSSSDPVDDYTMTVGPLLDGVVLFGDRAFLTFEEKAEFTFYAENDDQNFVNQRGKARLTLPLQRVGFFVHGRLDRLQERPLDLQDVRTDRDRDTLGAGVIFVPAWRMEIELAQSRSDLHYDDRDEIPSDTTISQRLDRDERETSLGVTYVLFGRARLTFDAAWRRTAFDSPLAAGKDSRGWSALPGFDFGLGGTLSGTARIGQAVIDADDPAIVPLREMIGDAAVAFRPGARTTLRLEARREPGYTVNGDDIYYLDSTLEGRGVYFLNRLFGLEAGLYTGRLTIPGSPREDERDGYDAGVRLRLPEDLLGRRIEYYLKLRHLRSRSNVESQNFTHTTLGFGATLGF
jgi:hypothetical protein